MIWVNKKSSYFFSAEFIWKKEITFIKSISKIFKISYNFIDNLFHFLLFIFVNYRKTFSYLCFILKIFREFVRNYIRKRILNLINKVTGFFGNLYSKYTFNLIVLKIIENFKKKKVYEIRSLRAKFFSKINKFKVLKFKKKSFETIFCIRKIEKFYNKINNPPKKKTKRLKNDNSKILRLWIECFKFFYMNRF